MNTSTQGWHADEGLLATYVTGGLDALRGASVEQHLTRCAPCRTAIGAVIDPAPLELAWAGIRAGIDETPQPLAVRIARRCGLPEPAAVLLAATTSLRTAWLVSSLVALGFALIAALLSDTNTFAPFLLVAPVVPVLGVAAAYGPSQAPLEALVVTAPYGRTRLILLRALAVLVSVLPFAALLGLLLPGPAWLGVAWLGPALALVPTMMAVASFIGPRAAAAGIVVGWCAIVVSSLRILPATWPVESTQQLGYLVLALVSGAVLTVRARRDQRIGAVL